MLETNEENAITKRSKRLLSVGVGACGVEVCCRIVFVLFVERISLYNPLPARIERAASLHVAHFTLHTFQSLYSC